MSGGVKVVRNWFQLMERYDGPGEDVRVCGNPDGKPKWDPHGLDVGKWAGVYPLRAQVEPTRKTSI